MTKHHSHNCSISSSCLEESDPIIFQAIQKEKNREQDHLELIASENFTSLAVLEAAGSILTNKYAEGYPEKRYYGGCQYVDIVEQVAIDRAKELFGAEHANVQPHSGSQANIAVYFATLKPGDKILSMSLEHGGHLTHGHEKNISGQYFKIVNYGVSSDNGMIDYDALEAIANQEKPQMITIGASAYPRELNFKRMGEIAKGCGALLMADIAHIAGLVAAGIHPSPIPHADFVTTTTHKTLRGPRGGMIMCKQEHAKAIDSAIFPGIQGGPLMHIIAAKAVCLGEALKEDFKTYQKQIKKNAYVMASEFIRRGYTLSSGGTDNHLLLIDFRHSHPHLTGKEAQIALDKANITTNKNTVPFETRSPFQASGLRLGTPAVTTRGMKEEEMIIIADTIDTVLNNINDEGIITTTRGIVVELCKRFPLPY